MASTGGQTGVHFDALWVKDLIPVMNDSNTDSKCKNATMLNDFHFGLSSSHQCFCNVKVVDCRSKWPSIN